MKISNPWLFLILVPAIACLIIFSVLYPFCFDDAFISFRITHNLISTGNLLFDTNSKVYTSTSILYPLWNSIWAIVFGENWTEYIPIVNGALMSVSYLIICFRIIQWLPGKSLFSYIAGMISIWPWLFDFRNFQYGNSGLETSLYMFLLSLTVTASPVMSARFPVFSWWLILVRPEGFLAGVARFFNSILTKTNLENRRSALFWAACSFVFWIMIGIVLFDNAIPQSMLAKANHLIDRKLELEKGLGYLMFSGHHIEMATVLLAFYIVPEIRKVFITPFVWLGLYIAFYSILAAWWPWYVPPTFIPCWFMLGIAVTSLASYAENALNSSIVRIVVRILLLGGVISATVFSVLRLNDTQKVASYAFQKRKKASEKIGRFISQTLPVNKSILIEPIGLIGWFSPNHSFLDYPGLSQPKMSEFLGKLKWKIPHRLTGFKTDSAITARFKPDYIVLWREEKEAFQNNIDFLLDYEPIKILPYFPTDKRMDSVWFFKRVQYLTR